MNVELKSKLWNDDGTPVTWLAEERGQRAYAIAMARKHLLDFTKFTNSEYMENWHHRVICEYLDRWAFGTGDQAIRRLMVFLPPGAGKFCANNTPVLTSTGWKTHGELKLGDKVFTECGNTASIIGVRDDGTLANREVVFSNGERIKTHANHEWKVWDKTRACWRVMETRAIEKSLCLPDGTWRFRLPDVSMLECHDPIFIISVMPCEPEPGQCIQVDSPDGIYLVSKSLIPTHNSELVSRRLPAWIFGRNPDANIMATSYSASLVRDMNRSVQRIIDSDSYHEVFPETRLQAANATSSSSRKAYLRNANEFEIVDHEGYYKCAGVGGSITGKRFFYGIIDDPIRGRQDAESVVKRKTVYDWYVNDFYTRKLNTDARILLTLTRWNADDLAGRLLDLAKHNSKAEQWTIIRFPMIAEDPVEVGDPRKPGESLWEWRYGTADDLEAVKIGSGSYAWASLYQQRPSPAGGSIFNRGWWGDIEAKPPDRCQFYSQAPSELNNSMDQIIISADCTLKDTAGTDYVVIQVWGRHGANMYLLDQTRGRMDVIGTMNAIRTLSSKWPRATAKLIEDTANGPAIISMLKREIPGLIPVQPLGGKVVRAQAITPYVEAGNVWLPRPFHAPWLNDFLEEVASFPSGTHDDQVDCLTQSLAYLQKHAQVMALPKVPRKPLTASGGWNG